MALLFYVGGFAAIRALLAVAGVHPHPQIVLDHWQHADLVLLDRDLWGTLWAHHAQPPLWNLILGLSVKAVGTGADAVSGAIHTLNMALSLLAGVMLARIYIQQGASTGFALAAGLVSVSLPSVLYYENYVFYPHLTFFLVVMLTWAVVFGARVWVVLVPLVLLCWTWALFHPAFVALFGLALIWARGTGAIAGVIVATVVASLPTVQNAIVFGTPSASSWGGFNIAQTAPGLGQGESAYCDLYLAHREIVANPGPRDPDHPSLGDPVKSSGFENMNHRALIDRSRDCMGLASRAIMQHPRQYAEGRWQAFVQAHSVWPFQYFFDPAGWEVFAPVEQALDSETGRLTTLIAHAVLWAFLLLKCVSGKDRGMYRLLVLIAGYVTIAAHVGNGAEQQRMLYTMSPACLIAAMGLLLAIVRRAGVISGADPPRMPPQGP